MFCIHCGARQTENGTFCSACGRLLPKIEGHPPATDEGAPAGPQLTPSERRRIYEEEKTRLHARQELERERLTIEARFRADRERWETEIREERARAYLAKRVRERRKRRYVIVGLIVVVAVLFFGGPGRRVRTDDQGRGPDAAPVPAGIQASPETAQGSDEGLAAEIFEAIGASDDFGSHWEAFLDASTSLVESGACTVGDLASHGGWSRSQIVEAGAVYYTRCDLGPGEAVGASPESRLYLNVATGEVFK